MSIEALTFDLVKLLHILAMAVWFGIGLSVASDVRKTLARGKPHTELLGARVGRTLMMEMGAGLITIVSGLGLIFLRGGMKGVPPRIHAGLGLAIVSYALLLVVIRPAASRIDEVIEKGDGNALRDLSTRLAMTTGIDHALKLVILVLMVVHIGG
jgi:hypothetical protein